MFHLLYDGTVMDQRNFAVLGGDAEAIEGRMREGFVDDLDLASAVRLGVSALGGSEREIPVTELEVATLQRGSGRRCFARLSDAEVTALLQEG
jgi:proteasome alpha subunit